MLAAAYTIVADQVWVTNVRTPDIPPKPLGKSRYLRTWVRTKTCPLFRTERRLTALSALLPAVGFQHSFAESRAEDSRPSPGRKCGPKPVRFFGQGEC